MDLPNRKLEEGAGAQAAPARRLVESKTLAQQIVTRVIVATVLLSIFFVAAFLTVSDRLIARDARDNVDRLVENVIPFAAMSAYSTSKFSADAALKLLEGSPWIARARIVDSFGETLAVYDNATISRKGRQSDEQRTIPLRMGSSSEVYGTLFVDIVYRSSWFARFFLYVSVIGIVLTGASIAVLLFAVVHSLVLRPLAQIEKELTNWPDDMHGQFSDYDYGSRELEDLSRAFQKTLDRTATANEDRNRALAMRALLADSIDNALARANIFLASTRDGEEGVPYLYGTSVPPSIRSTIDALTEPGSDIVATLASKKSSAAITTTGRYTDDRKGADVVLAEALLPDKRVWFLTCVDLGDDRRTVVGAEITELKKLSQEAESARRLEAVGVLASGVAHDFNNVLAIIIGALDLYGRTIDPTPMQVQIALRAARRGSMVTRMLLDASHADISPYEALDIADFVHETAAQIVNLFDGVYLLDVDLQTDGHVAADGGQLQTTLINLVINARDASAPGAVITFRTRAATIPEIVESGLNRSEDYVVFEIVDKGVGIASDVLPRVFEPFFTTKERGRGTGLGLAMARSFAARSRGKIMLRSDAGVGTQVRLILPRHTSEPIGVERQAPALRAQRRLQGRRILVVEDEAEFLRTLTDYIGMEGGVATGVGALAHALVAIAGENPPFDIVVSDVMLPDGLGVALLDAAVDGKLKCPVILMGGNFDPLSLTSRQSEALAGLLRKPFLFDEFTEALVQALSNAKADAPTPGASEVSNAQSRIVKDQS
ncbi:MAG: hypothetical protein KGL46_00215 [Hyphomicrobiales bacterium]|nr:hypothetical protein [Hyphomicrobiales bacterium]